ncbi:MAG: DinB family protein [bacterium]|nr:DinB family protein [bacterium]
MNAQTIAQALTVQFNYTGHVTRANLLGLSDADALVQPQPAGNCANWVAGHIAHSRVGVLAMLGSNGPYAADKYQRYSRGSEPMADGEGASPLSEIVADLEATQPAILAALQNMTDEGLAEAAPFSPSGDENETVGSLLVGLAFHEAYHTGQLGVLRRVSGHEGVVK